ncbi:sigma factor [Streptosporangium sandarakinum]|uniref:sigma factor n=1 Tax=Streptosporangium sandarakinum TaxID=1260955 RepID=UPI00369DCE46
MTAPPDSPGRLDDTALIEQSRHRPESFATLYDRHFGDIYRYVAARIGPQAADDLASETFLVAFRKRDGFDPERGAVRRWLYGIATNLLADHRRSETRRLEALARVPVASPAESEHADRVAARVTAAGERTAERLRGRWKGTAGDLIWDSITWQEARAIPGDPGRLRTYLERHVRRQVAHPDSGMDVEKEMPRLLRAVCIRMITGLPVSPEARASAYRILASLPGIRAGGETTDPLGRRGQALVYREEAEPGLFTEIRFVVDPGTGLPLAEMRMNVAKGADGRPVELPSSTSYQVIGWTDERPEPPARRD